MAEVKSNLVDLTVVYSNLNKTIDENISRLNSGATAVENYNKKLTTIPSEFQKSLVDIKSKTDAISNSTKSLIQVEKQANQERLKEIQIQKQREQSVDKYNAQLAKEEQKLNAANNLYSKIQAKVNLMTAGYQNLSAKKELGITLTSKEEQAYNRLYNGINKYQTVLKAVDANMGKYSRNVGNYAGSFNPLNNSIAQLTREAPAFANSVQTGFMAISNNLPIFFDAMQNVINQNKELQAQGKPTKNVLGQLASGLFSFQTLLSVGVTLLTIYGKEIVEWATSLSTAEKTLKSFKNAQIEIQSQSVSQAKDLDKYRDVVVNTSLSEKERLRALKLLKEQIPELSKVELNHADAINKVNQYTEYYIRQAAIRYKADGFIKKAGEELIKQEEIRLKISNKELGTGFTDYLKGSLKAVASGNLMNTSLYSNVTALERMNKEFEASVDVQKKYEIAAETEIRLLDVKKKEEKLKVLKAEKDLVFELVDVYASMFEINKFFLEREIKMHDEIANSEHETLEDRLRNFSKFTDRKLELEILEYNESVRLNDLSYKNEVDNITNTYIEYVKQDNVTKSQRISAKNEQIKALKALEEKNKLDLQLLELKHTDSILEINAETFEKIAKLRELYSGLGFNKKIKDQELKDLLEHKNRLLNIDINTTKKQLDSVGKATKDANRKIQEQVLQNDIANINKKLDNEKLGVEAELRLKTELYEKLKALNQLEISDLEEKKKKQEDYLKLLEDTFKGFIDDFGGNSGFGKMLDILNGGLDKFQGNAKAVALTVSEAFQEAFNTISAASQANFEAEYTRLEMQKEISLKFAGESTSAKEEIERQYEERRREIARRKAESDKKLAVFNILIDTAQAVVAALPNYFLAAAIGVFGAAQAIMVNSQPIPAFADGGEHDGGFMLVNDAKGSNYKETIVNPDGKIEKPTGRNVVMNRKKGTQIFTHDQWNEVINRSLVNAGIQPMRSMVDSFEKNNSLSTNDFNAGISKLAKTMQSNKGSNTQVFLNNRQINTDYFKGEKV